MPPKDTAVPPMTLSLTRAVAVHCFRVVGDVSFARQRDDLRAIALYAIERGGELTVDALHAALLPKLPHAASRRMLKLGEDFGLFKSDRPECWTLTADGHRTAREGTVLVPERGAWTLWLTDDPLVPVSERLLRVEPFKEPNANAEAQERKGATERRQFVKLPSWARDCVAAFAGSPGWSQDRERVVRVVHLEPEVEAAAHTSALRLTVTLSPDTAGVVELRGTLDEVQSARAFAPPASMTFSAAWALAMGPRVQDWDGRSLGVAFQELSDTARERMLHTLAVAMPPNRDWGSLEAAPVRDVPVRPRTANDAQAWAEWLATSGVTAYATRQSYRALWERIAARFPEHRVTAMPQRELASRFRARSGPNPPRYWHLQAPMDWNL